MNTLHKVLDGKPMTQDEARALMERMMAGELSPVQTAALLAALKVRGETPDEIAGFAHAMREAARPVRVAGELMDVVGTGGDGAGTFNISTTVAFVLAAAGLKVAKHGNRAASSRSGSADLLEALGVNIELEPERVARVIEEVGIGFLFARTHHPAMRHVAPVRAELKTRTVFNVLGPLTNPARAQYFLLGVYSPELLEPMAYALSELGALGAWVVHSRGTDELTLGENEVVELRNGRLRRFTFRAADYGLEEAPLAALAGGAPEENAALTRRILAGEERGPKRDVVALNAAAGLVAAGRADSLEEGLEAAGRILDEGEAARVLERLVEATRAHE
ncbi:anthranilate phosphoribosyltransferase [Oceanithermus profundus DSM 14977]|uniref:Anthranilate phosphoribosyltransferase n=1 Tax=Oceanithermus profundus (strain DSM 14977 / NBRC 100410 / VKM B-2274 / 506) TaxID=670487 RepID=E4U563_OCEP5|nr:anthranilate phosphoribosyltransferase [Oceanithermus profundus]ADR37475.1 anthranilate phosphoribosyltransferase [Oceanithermus profundus DSM 14977]